MKRYAVLIVTVISSVAVMAQFDPQVGQYMYIKTAYNPAAAGEDDLMKVSALFRAQFAGIKNAPMSTFFTLQSPFVIGKTKHGAGVRFMDDRYGLFSNQTFHVQYAYKQHLGKGHLSVGVDLGFVSVGFKGDSVNLSQLKGSLYHQADDQLIPSGSQTGMAFDMGLGVYYSAPKWYAGISYTHLTQPKVEWSENSDVRLRGTLFAVGGYNWRLKNKNFVLKPSLLMMTDFVAWDVNVSLLCEYKEKFRWGLNYRVAAGVGVYLGADIITGLVLGYHCELPTNKLMLESYGSHEVYLAYGFDILKPKRTNRYKSVRYL